MNRRVDQFRAIKGQILAFEYTQLPASVKEWSDFEEMGVVMEVPELRKEELYQ